MQSTPRNVGAQPVRLANDVDYQWFTTWRAGGEEADILNEEFPAVEALGPGATFAQWCDAMGIGGVQ